MTGRDVFMILAGGGLASVVLWIVSEIMIYRMEKRITNRRW